MRFAQHVQRGDSTRTAKAVQLGNPNDSDSEIANDTLAKALNQIQVLKLFLAAPVCINDPFRPRSNGDFSFPTTRLCSTHG